VTPTRDIDWLALSAYFTETATPEQRAELEAWLRAAPSRQAALETLRQRWLAVVPSPVAVSSDMLWDRFAAELETARAMERTAHVDPSIQAVDSPSMPAAPTLRSVNTPHRPRLFRRFGGRAFPRTVALVAVLAVVGGGVWVAQRRGETTPPAYEHVSAAGQLTAISLPDGTRVLLAPGSRVRYDDAFGRTRRDVYLDGKAYFEVAADAMHPFTVLTNLATVQVLGTSFAVDRYSGDDGIEVVVNTGRVFVAGTGADVRTGSASTADATRHDVANVLSAGDVLRVGSDGAPTIQHDANLRRALAWTRGVLAFHDAPLRKVLDDVGRWYGVRLALVDTPERGTLSPAALQERRITTTLDQVPLSVVTRELSMLVGVRVVVADETGAASRERAGSNPHP
jgi:transmembrane sensor